MAVALQCPSFWAAEDITVYSHGSFLWSSTNTSWNEETLHWESDGSLSSAHPSPTCSVLYVREWFCLYVREWFCLCFKGRSPDVQPINQACSPAGWKCLASKLHISVLLVSYLIHSGSPFPFSSAGSTHCGRPEYRPQSKSQLLLESEYCKWFHEQPAVSAESANDGEETDPAQASHGAQAAAPPPAADAGWFGKATS